MDKIFLTSNESKSMTRLNSVSQSVKPVEGQDVYIIILDMQT